MGLDAFVPCNCFREGKTTPSPVPVDEIYDDGEGHLCCWDADKSLPEEEIIELESTFYRWQMSCCEHEDMKYANERVGNWSTVRFFQWFVSQLSETQYPYIHELSDMLDQTNVTSEKAALMLLEFLILEKNFPDVKQCVLVDLETDEVIQTRIEAYDGAYAYWGYVYEMGISPTGLFVRNRETNEVLFQAKRVRQTILSSDPKNGQTLLEDLDEPEHKLVINIGGYPDEKKVTLMEVQMHPLTIDDVYSFVALKKLLQASVETGNSIYWC